MQSWLLWAIGMLGLDFIEFLALVEIVYSDLHSSWALGKSLIVPYFYLSTASFFLQFAGVILAALGWYKFGGVVQIVASTVHIPKGEGLIGIVGGLQAYRVVQQPQPAAETA